jgi:Domain of unknown function (DUF4386)
MGQMATSISQDNLSERLFHLLSRLSLVIALSILVYTAFYFAATAAATDKAIGQGYGALRQAIHSPVLFRLAWLSESLSWLVVGGTLIIFAGLFARRTPIRAACIAATGIGQLFTSLGAYSLSNVSVLAMRYATAAPSQQAALLQSFLDLQGLTHSAYDIGLLLQGAGFLLVAWVAWERRGFPRWLTVWLAIAGLPGLGFFIVGATDAPSALAFALVVLGSIGLMVVYVTMAVIFWRLAATVHADVASASAAAQQVTGQR